MAPLSQRARGRLIMLVGILAVTPDALFIRMLAEAGTDNFCIIAWKMAFSCLFTGLYTVFCPFQPRALLQGLRRAGPYLLPAVLVQSATNVGFTMSLIFGSAARTLLFVNLNLLWTTLLGVAVLHERLPRRTLAALAVCLGAVLLIFVPDIVGGGGGEQSSEGPNPMLGSVLGTATGVGWATTITIVRHAQAHRPGAKFSAVVSLSTALAAAIGAAMQGPSRLSLAAGGFRGPEWEFWVLIIADAATVSCVFVAMSIAPAMIPGAEVSVILLLEIIIAPIWIGLVYSEAPPFWTLLGGAVILAALVGHELAPLIGRRLSVTEGADKAGDGVEEGGSPAVGIEDLGSSAKPPPSEDSAGEEVDI